MPCQNPPCSALGWRLCPRSPCRGSAPAGPGRLYYRCGCFPPAAGKLLFLASPHPAGSRVVNVLRPGQDRSRKLTLPRRGSLRQPPARSAGPSFSADSPGQPSESPLGIRPPLRLAPFRLSHSGVYRWRFRHRSD